MTIVLPGNAELLEERLKPPIQKGQPLADKVVLVLLLTMFYGLIAFIPLDVFRLHLLRGPGTAVSCLGLCLFIAGWSIASLALKENTFAARVVRHQGERRQKVIDTGVYGVVRHPMYTGSLCIMVGMSLWLGSYAAAILAVVPTCMLVLRVHIEEGFLKRVLAGYDGYTERVTYRLIPFVW
jgi:protein-S-isoprenylcysteine O-methyltransferase Ste14